MVAPERWFEVHFVVSVVSFFLLIIAIPIYAEKDELPPTAGAVAGLLLAASVLCAFGVGYAHKRRDQRALLPVFLFVVGMHIGMTCVTVAEWVEDDCDKSVFALCTDGEKNFLAVFLINLAVQLIFLYEYKMLLAWKNALVAERRHTVVDASGGTWKEDERQWDNESTIAVATETD